MKKLFLSFFVLLALNTSAQNQYDVDKIPADLLKGASTVIRYEQHIFDVKNKSTATETYKTAVTIVNKNGEDASSMVEYYSKFASIYNLRAAMYDAKGNKIKDYKSADFKDKSAISDGTMYQDERLKELNFLNTNYPYTIEYSYSRDYSGLNGYPSWYPVSSFDQSLENSEYIFRIPDQMSFKYLKSSGLKTDSIKNKDKTEYKWTCSNIKALEYEPLSTGLRNIMPWVSLAPNQFEYDGSAGNMENWKTVGSWLYGLNNYPQELPADIKLKVGILIQNSKTPKEKIRKLYNYLQTNTRYVSVQLGIGGQKPIAADKVAAVNYGDCKGLSNYMRALLKEAGISSNLVVIGSGLPSMNPDFASLNQANHMILCVPLEKDTVWLECTSQHKPAGFLSNDCSDKNVLLVTSDGGKLVRTPTYTPADNYQKRTISITINEQGAADIRIKSEYGAAQFENNFPMMLLEPIEQKKQLMNILGVPNMEIASIQYTQPDKDQTILKEEITLKSSQLFSKAADRTLLSLNLLNRRETVPAKITDRKTYFAVSFGYHDEDEIIYTLPKGFKVDFLPKDVLVESEFGKYTAKATAKDNAIVYTRTQTMNGKKYGPEKYNALVDFYKKIYQADKVKAILAKVN